MNLYLKYSRATFFALTFLILYSSLQYILILRHKSPYLSDSYFYKHMYYQFQGSDFETAYQKIKSQQDFSNQDKISKKIFLNKEAYMNSYSFFTKRPLYPYTAYLLNKIFNNEILSFTLPVFVSYVGVVVMTFVFFKQGLNLFFGTFGTFVFVSFYPYLDLSTYFLTDTIGAFFWLIQLSLIYKYLTEPRAKWLFYFTITLILSLLNREQSLLILLALFISQILFFKFQTNTLPNRNIKIILITFIVAVTYIICSSILHQKNIIDTITYTMNSYGYYNSSYTFSEVFNYLVTAHKSSHLFLIKDLASHHIWFTFVIFSVAGLFFTFKNPTRIDILMVASGTASYLAIFLYPVLSYRYFFPAVIAICYFSALSFSELFNKIAKLELSKNAN